MSLEIHISVRNLVEFLLRSGDLDNRIKGSAQAMLAGSKIHRRLQKQAGGDYRAEVSMACRYVFDSDKTEANSVYADRISTESGTSAVGSADADTEDILTDAAVIVEGRADGIYSGIIPPNALDMEGKPVWFSASVSEDETSEITSNSDPETGASCITIDEIKGTYRNVHRMRRPEPVHVAQARCYGYMYVMAHDLPAVQMRMTYCNLDTEEVRYFYERMTRKEICRWFDGIRGEYRKWAAYTLQWRERRTASIRSMSFPFPYREGQKELAADCYRTIVHGRKLFLEAPTGSGKTITTLFPAVKAMGEGKAEKIFYLTAKTIARTVAEDTVALMRQRNLQCKSVTLTAREKICMLDKPDCNPKACPRAKGHFDRVNEAIYALLTERDDFSRASIEEYAEKYQVCPFEMGLDMSLFSDVIIGDYNYVFDPHAYLRRFFGEGEVRRDYLFLIDEAHNLVDRGREMYSAQLTKEAFLEVRRAVKGCMPRIEKHLSACNTAMLDLRRQVSREGEAMRLEAEDIERLSACLYRLQAAISEYLEDYNRKKRREDENPEHSLKSEADRKKKKSRKKKTKANTKTNKNTKINANTKTNTKAKTKTEAKEEGIEGQLSLAMLGLALTDEPAAEITLDVEAAGLSGDQNTGLVKEKTDGDADAGQDALEDPTAGDDTQDSHALLLELYFALNHFLMIYEKLDEKYVIYAIKDETFMIRLFNVDPSTNLKECMDRGRASILFSATLLPIQYYKSLLGGTGEDYEVYARSIFDPGKRALLVADDVTSRYTRRGPEEYARIADYIHRIGMARYGNYMVFFPSYAFMREVYRAYQEIYPEAETEIWIQKERMSEADREEFLGRFTQSSQERSFYGFCVLGGIFSEGVDLKKDALIGAVIVGTGLPQVCHERELLKDYFAKSGVNGYDYAYRYPGMNKVLQAAGRVIRTSEDIGVVALLDDRFLQSSYRMLFPREWSNYEEVSLEQVSHRMDRFWDEWL